MEREMAVKTALAGEADIRGKESYGKLTPIRYPGQWMVSFLRRKQNGRNGR